MILVDTSVWIDHLRSSDEKLATMLERDRILIHPFVIGELALGNLQTPHVIISNLQDLPRITVASDDEVMGFIETRTLAGQGIGYVDAHLLAAVQLTPGASLWTTDKRLALAAIQLGVNF